MSPPALSHRSSISPQTPPPRDDRAGFVGKYAYESCTILAASHHAQPQISHL